MMLEYWLSIVTIAISLLALTLSGISFVGTRRLSRLRLQPNINFTHIGPLVKTVDTKTTLAITIKNNGLGPATIMKVIILTDADTKYHIHESWDTVIEEMGISAPYVYYNDIGSGVVMPAGESVSLIWIEPQVADRYTAESKNAEHKNGEPIIRTHVEMKEFFQKVKGVMGKILIVVVYKNVFDEINRIFWSEHERLRTAITSQDLIKYMEKEGYIKHKWSDMIKIQFYEKREKIKAKINT